ncbi:Mobile element protein [Serinicoccus hydrothermalis]|uniref:Mobile element protein n=1 Tax=Serinicoccus hydrothermalis TaxID=1758689 RepID=A0A1B1ND47_9MICO|nr:Mobile element protein [Serinicoccus hydrothermalis]
MLVNARDAKNLPGRKTDVSDAAWLAQLAAHGLLRASFVPPEPIRALRDLTRTRTAITRARTREAQRLEKVLEDAGIKLSVVATDIMGVSGRAMLEALIAGEHDPAVLADLAHPTL